MMDKTDKKDKRPRYALFAGGAALVTVAILIAVKGLAYIHTGSVSVLASLIDSFVDAVASLINFSAIRYALRPADHEHRHGHGKAEGLAALFQGAFICGAGVFLVMESVSRFMKGSVVEDHGVAVAVMAFSIVMTALLVGIQNFALRRAPSLAVESEKKHYSMDVVINGGVMAVAGALHYGAPAWIDPVFGLGVAAWLGLTAYTVARQGVDMLLDKELPGNARETIIKRVMSCAGVMGMHDLRTTRSGMHAFISFDIAVDPDLSLRQAHEIARAVEHALLADFPHAEILIHVDPNDDTEDTRHKVAGVHDR